MKTSRGRAENQRTNLGVASGSNRALLVPSVLSALMHSARAVWRSPRRCLWTTESIPHVFRQINARTRAPAPFACFATNEKLTKTRTLTSILTCLSAWKIYSNLLTTKQSKTILSARCSDHLGLHFSYYDAIFWQTVKLTMLIEDDQRNDSKQLQRNERRRQQNSFRLVSSDKLRAGKKTKGCATSPSNLREEHQSSTRRVRWVQVDLQFYMVAIARRHFSLDDATHVTVTFLVHSARDEGADSTRGPIRSEQPSAAASPATSLSTQSPRKQRTKTETGSDIGVVSSTFLKFVLMRSMCSQY